MKLQHLTALSFVLLGLTSLACSAPDDEIIMGNDDEGGSGGSNAGSGNPGAGTGTGSGGKAQGGTGSGGSSNEAGNPTGGTGSGGTGMGGSATGGTGSGGWDPCAGKACGDFCQPCDPKDANCVAPAVEMTCTANGQCSIGRPACTIPECEAPQQYYAPGCDAAARPIAAPPFVAGCYDACTSAGKCADGFTCTPVWHDPSVGCLPGQGCIAACGAQANICIAN